MDNIIRQKLKEIEEKENIKIMFAVESGSRAWGFASNDSDYDIRFVYIRPLKDYLHLEKTNDMINWQLDNIFDINGWDLKKALQLLHDSNPTIFEWLFSPITYQSSDAFEQLKVISKDYYSKKKSLYHYWHMANNNYQAYLQDDIIRIKKYFYVIRPLLAAKWIIDKKSQPSMLFSELVNAELPKELEPIINDLLEKKAKSSEMGLSTRIKELDDFINSQLDFVKSTADEEEPLKTDWNILNEFFYEQITFQEQF